jgi:hypothetical protein
MFQDGWGEPNLLESMQNRDRTLRHLANICVDWDDSQTKSNSFVRHGTFTSPCQEDGFPEESRTGYVCYVRPRGNKRKALVLHMAATGEIGFKQRLYLMALPLARKGIGSIILENPYYGQRKPPGQEQHLVRTVFDLGMMFRASVMEGIALLRWARGFGWEKIAVSGCSMGGLAASVISALTGFPVALSAFLIPHSAVPIFTQGVLRRECDWGALMQDELNEDAAINKLIQFLKNVDLAAFPPPNPQDAAIIVNAKEDAFIPGASSQIIQSLWPEAELRTVSGGHVRAFLKERPAFHQAIEDALARLTVTFENSS